MKQLPSTTGCQSLPTANCQLTTDNWLHQSRCGTTLVEMLVVISVAAVMVGVSACTIHLLLDAEREASRAVRFSTSVARLTQAFRSDVHAARQVDLPAAEEGKPAVLVATVDGGLVRYELDAHLATRIETAGEREVQREVYYFPPHSRLRFERGADQKIPGRNIVVLEIDMAAGGSGIREVPSAVRVAPQRRLAIEAVLGRDHRFEKEQ